ncbi:AAA family ATPase [[Kitasatospora] papulosa]|uniref:AAA family ATPase n=1 Tax=[Kitasatospora] papulosa TaxID=1464011 RepID=UPI0036838E7B
MESVRGFHGSRAVDLDFTRPGGTYAGWTVLAGRNGSGKTTLLQAIAMCLIGERRTMQLVPNLESWISKDSQEAAIGVVITNDPLWDYGYTTSRDTAVMVEWNTEGAMPERDGTPLFEPPRVGSDRILRVNFRPEEETLTPLWSGAQYPGWFVAAYGPFRRLSGADSDGDIVFSQSTGLAIHNSNYPEKTFAVRTLFNEKESLSEAVSWLIQLHLARFEERPGAAELLEMTLALLQDGLLPDGYTVHSVNSEGLWIAHQSLDKAMPLRAMSDGYRTVVVLVLDIIRRIAASYPYPTAHEIVESNGTPTLRHPGVVLIDEIDAHLHVSWQQRIGEWLKRHFPNIQFIVTTHSPYICQAADANGLIRLPGPDEAEGPSVVEPELYRRVVYGTGDDAVISDLFGLDTPYSQEARELREKLVKLEAAVVRGVATSGDLQTLRDLKKTLSSSPVTRVDEISARLIGEEGEGV